ncbi:MAG: hypothetical protein B6D72_15000 [gamma proteobacterium symbiont of Ctena orbiculata]|uniref:Uncharacterized protein n=1 Tax=Candidatus Thiodiazotropha taylori TaxID=2792791 RepID=A0A944M681_9GAMM|nr:hypothetical protein [Candidatus Thiodiazotropha taylori]PUB86559.1 MAG: hypothetical protein DBP00_10595 [gamma proteobacterium symbiont of Ctena orbiculata]MBT2987944.1 hypothetical protein [Candidatus Thiodiazotropha taylori]MBT2997589.1 hypothetical protein [Candidatus Thiodiazotropha taylori]MBT2998985.1 hypothetical protein [Candidatus Thiodiazotropha taylori]
MLKKLTRLGQLSHTCGDFAFRLAGGHLSSSQERIGMRRGAKHIIGLFLLTIATAVLFQGQLFLLAAIGLMTGLSYLQFFGYFLK